MKAFKVKVALETKESIPTYESINFRAKLPIIFDKKGKY